MSNKKKDGIITLIIGLIITGLVAHNYLWGNRNVFIGFGVIGVFFIIIGIKNIIKHGNQ